MNIITLDEATKKVPAISATSASPRCSSRYNFVSTRNIVEKAAETGWSIVEVKGSRVRGNGSPFGAHSVRMVHSSQLSKVKVDSLKTDQLDGYPTLNIVNSHDLTKKFTLAIGYYRLICSNGLIAPAGMANSINSRHSFNEEQGEMLIKSIDEVFSHYTTVTDQIDCFKDRQLSDSECEQLASFAKRIRFRFRKSPPIRIDHTKFLQPRRDVDRGKDLWTVFNVIQENMTHGGDGLGKGITRFQDDLRFNTEMWEGAAVALVNKSSALKAKLDTLFVKKERSVNN